MYWFGFAEFVIILGFLALCILFLILINRRIRKSEAENQRTKSKNIALSVIVAGIIIIVLSVAYHLKMRVEVMKIIEILRPISEMTAAPIFLLTILIIMLGLTLISAGILMIRK